MNQQIPIIDSNIKKYDFNFNEEIFKKFQNLISKKPGLSTNEYVKLIDFYDFTEESLEYAFCFFNTYKNTFHGICGPFIKYNNKWYPKLTIPEFYLSSTS